MTKYRVSCWDTSDGFYTVEAKNIEEAKKIANQKLWNGDKMDSITDIDKGVGEATMLTDMDVKNL